MNVLLKQATIIDSGNAHHGKVADIFIEKGIITQIKKSITSSKGVKTVEVKGLHVSPGWLDMQVNFCDPGYEHKETLKNGLKAAIKGGFTGVCVLSGTNPPLYNKAQIEYITNRASEDIIDVYPIGTLSHKQEGKDLSEMYDMQLAGALAFSDYKNPIQDSGLVLRALQYASNIGSFIMTHCEDTSISQGGQMNEGIVSTNLGLKGIPALAEEVMLQRNLQILEYTGGKLHIPTISTKGSVELIKKAKAKKLNVTCGVAAYQLLLDDFELEGFDANYKVNPPLRTKEDIDALKKGIADGTIDVIVSDHQPQDVEGKELEFDLAANGMIGLESYFGVVYKALHQKLDLEKIIDAFTKKPRLILGLPEVSVKEGLPANLTLFTIHNTFVFDEKQLVSSSKNSGLIGKELIGSAVGIIHKNQFR